MHIKHLAAPDALTLAHNTVAMQKLMAHAHAPPHTSLPSHASIWASQIAIYKHTTAVVRLQLHTVLLLASDNLFQCAHA